MPHTHPTLQPADSIQHGLRPAVLTFSEVLAQSISAVAPSTAAALAVPLVYALAGEGTCLAYCLATLAMVLVALCITVFARSSASPGSLYVYAHSTLPPFWAAATAWSLVFAYLATASSVLAGFVFFASGLLHQPGALPTLTLAVLGAAGAIAVAYKDIQLSARVMLYVEAVSVLLITLVVGSVLAHHGFHLDLPQAAFSRMHFSSVRLGVVLAIFSFVGFESATSLGAEANRPLRTIPAAVLWSTLLSGLFFVVSAYGEVLAFRGLDPSLATSPTPMRTLCLQAGLAPAGAVIEAGVMVSMFAATLAFVIALGRLLLLMAHHRLVPAALARTSPRHKTPSIAGVAVGTLALVPVAVLLARGATGAEVYGWMGSLAVFGYLTAYLSVAVAVLFKRARVRQLTPGVMFLAGAAILALLIVTLSTLYPAPPAPYLYFPFCYLLFLLLAGAWHRLRATSAQGKNL